MKCLARVVTLGIIGRIGFANTKLDSELDVLMLGCIFPKYCSVTAKKSLKYTPFLGWFSKFSRPCDNSIVMDC